MIMDLALEGRKNLVCGANEQDYHFRNVTPGRDFQPDAHGGHPQRERGRRVARVSGTPAQLGKAVEVGHIFKLGYRYSKPWARRS